MLIAMGTFAILDAKLHLQKLLLPILQMQMLHGRSIGSHHLDRVIRFGRP